MRHCKHGHPLTADNILFRKEGGIPCKKCRNENEHRCRIKRSAELRANDRLEEALRERRRPYRKRAAACPASWVLGRTLVFHFTFKLGRGPFCRGLPPDTCLRL